MGMGVARTKLRTNSGIVVAKSPKFSFWGTNEKKASFHYNEVLEKVVQSSIKVPIINKGTKVHCVFILE